MKPLIKSLTLLVILFFCACGNLKAQCDPVLRPDTSQFYLDGAIQSSARDSNILYIGGNFLNIGKRTGAFIGADSVHGKPMHLDTWPQVSGIVYASAPDGSGGWIIGGSFTTVGGVARNNLAQINGAGQLSSWNPNSNNLVNAIVVSGNNVYVGGSFTNVGGQFRNRIAAIDITTAAAMSWNPNSSGTINSLVLNNSILYAGGGFSTIGGQSRQNIAALDIVTGTATSWNPGVGNTVQDINISGNTMYVGGIFTTVAGQPRNRIGAIDITTATATSWNPNSSAIVYSVYANGSTVYAGGTFTSIGGQPRVGFAELSSATGSATAVDLSLSAGADIREIKVYGSSLYIGGTFTTINGQPKNNIAQINIPTHVATAWTANTLGAVYTLQPVTGGIYVGGNFNVLGMQPRTRIAAIDVNMDTLLAWKVDSPPTSGSINAVCFNKTEVFIGGTFNFAGHLYLAAYNKLTGAINNAFPFGVTNSNPQLPPPYISALVASDTSLFAAGSFNQTIPYNAFAHNRCKFNLYGLYVDNVTGMNANTYYRMQLVDSLIYTGADPIGGVGSFDTAHLVASTWTPNADGPVRGFAIRGTDMYAGGDFNNICGSFLPRLAKIKINNVIPVTTWNPYPNSYVKCVSTDGTIVYAAGNFTTIGENALARNYLAAIDGNGDATTWAPNPNNDSIKIVETYKDKLYVGGGFTTISGKSETYLAIYKTFTPDPEVTIQGNLTPCAGSLDTFTASTLLANPIYQWQVNGNNIGSNSSTFVYTPAVGDDVRCIVTIPAGGCYLILSDTSNVIAVTVTPYTTPTISITGNATVCTGSLATYTATTNIVGGTYQWRVNNIIVGTNSSTYTYTPLNGDQVKCFIYTPAGCYSPASAISNTITVIVNPMINATASVSTPNLTVCSGIQITCTATTNVTGGSYQWKVNNLNAGSNSSTYSYVPNNGDQIICVITGPAGSCYTPSPVTSNTITMTVDPTIIPTVSISGNANVCAGASVTYTATGNIGGAAYQWQVNNTNVGGNQNTYTYTPSNSDQVKCIITAPPGCYSPATGTSNIIAMTVNQYQTPAISISAPTFSAVGSAVVVNATISNVGPSYTIDWKNNAISFDNGPVPYTSYTKGPGTDNITATITSSGCYNVATSNSINVFVAPVSVNEIGNKELIRLYPNPFGDNFTVSGIAAGDKLQLIDMTGKTVSEWNAAGTEMQIKTGNIAAGSYMLRIADKNGVVIENMPIRKR